MKQKDMTEKSEGKKEKSSRSPVWSYFKVCEDNAVLADCLLCGARMTRGGSAPSRCGTTNLRRHVLYAHNISLPSAKKETEEHPRKQLNKKSVIKCPPPVLKKGSVRKKTKELLKKPHPSQKEVKRKIQVVKEEIVTQPEPVMCIKWNTYLSNMTSALPNLMNDEQFVDVTLACEGQSLKCHKVVLAACSPYLHHLLTSANCPHPVIVFKDYLFWELQVLVAFMYSGEVNVPQSQLPRILRVAESLQIKGLAKPASKSEPLEEDLPLWNELLEAPTSESTGGSAAKRKRKPSSHNCCKVPPKAAKYKTKAATLVKSRNKPNPSKKKVVKSAPKKKLKLPPVKKSNAKKCSQPPDPSPEDEVILPQLPELADMLSEEMLDSADIGVGLPLPAAHVDSIFPLPDFKVDGDPEAPDIAPFLANGLHPTDLLHHISPECRLDEDPHEVR